MFMRVKQGSNSLQIHQTEGQVFLIVGGGVEVTGDHLGLAFRVGTVGLPLTIVTQI